MRPEEMETRNHLDREGGSSYIIQVHVPVVSGSNTCIEPLAVVVKTINTFITDFTVLSTGVTIKRREGEGEEGREGENSTCNTGYSTCTYTSTSHM